jgi:hydroxymethylbilane synthase
MHSTLIFATRPSALARWQTSYAIQQIQVQWENLVCQEIVITTKGDRDLTTALPEIGGKGLFTSELEQALREGGVHAAVHSLKDLPTEESPGLTIGAIPERADVRDVLVSPAGLKLEELPAGAVVGTSSIRRQAQILAYRPDLRIQPIRGNIDTRIRKVQEGQYDAILLAAAGIIRLGLEEHITQYLPLDIMLPAPGQGALAIQCRADDEETLRLLSAIEQSATRRATSAERAFLAGLGGGCSLPVGAVAEIYGGAITLRGIIASPDGNQILRLTATGGDPILVGQDLAQQALERGARALVQQVETGSQS